MIITKLDISCIWGGTLKGVLLKNDATFGQTTTKIIGVHGWLDNLNSLIQIAEKLVDHHPSNSKSLLEEKSYFILFFRLRNLSI